MKNIYKLFLGVLFIIPFLFSCEKDKNLISSEDSVYVFINDVMHYWYLWYDEVPEVDIFSYNKPSELLNALKYKPRDKWSYIDYAETINSYFEEGEYFGFGFYFRFDEMDNLRVILVYEDSEAYRQGIRKGDIITNIDDISPVYFHDFESFFDDSPKTLKFTVFSNDAYRDITLSKTTVQQNSVLYSDTHSINGTNNVGYLVYDSFLGYSKSELEETINFFKASNIDDIIIDLRYNGGGYVNIAKEFAEMIIPHEKVGEICFSTVHNDLINSEYDSTEYFSDHPLNLDLDRVFFITSNFSASASELLINCLKPHMEVITVGSATYGKPVGMYGFQFHEWMMLPVTVKTVNADGYGDYYQGLPVDATTGEGLDKPWGDTFDPALRTILLFIKNGSFSTVSMETPKSSSWNEKLSFPQIRDVMIFGKKP
jgi:hypothetical protein